MWFGEGQKCFCPVPCLQFVIYMTQFYKSNTGQLELFCHVLHILANQTHFEIKVQKMEEVEGK